MNTKQAIKFYFVSIFLTWAVPFEVLAQKAPLILGNDEIVQLSTKETKYLALIKGNTSSDGKYVSAWPGLRNATQEQVDEYLATYSRKQSANNTKLETMAKSLKGGVDTGGGTLIRINRGLFSYSQLIDFYNFAPNLNESSYKKIRIPPTNIPNSCPLRPSFNGRTLNRLFENQILSVMMPLAMGSRDETAFAGINRNLILEAMDNTEFIFSERRLGEAAVDSKAYLKESSNHIQRIPLAVYIQGQGTIASLPDFNEISGQNQVGLIVHEILRQISIGYKLYVSDYDLQEITAQLMSRSKSSWLITNDEEFLKARLPQEIYMGPFTKYAVRALLNDICSFAQIDNPDYHEGPECKNLPAMEISKIYSKIQSIREEISDTNLCAWDCKLIDQIDLKWLRQVDMAQDRFYRNGKAYRTSGEISKLSYNDNECEDFVQFLQKEKFLK